MSQGNQFNFMTMSTLTVRLYFAAAIFQNCVSRGQCRPVGAPEKALAVRDTSLDRPVLDSVFPFPIVANIDQFPMVSESSQSVEVDVKSVFDSLVLLSIYTGIDIKDAKNWKGLYEQMDNAVAQIPETPPHHTEGMYTADAQYGVHHDLKGHKEKIVQELATFYKEEMSKIEILGRTKMQEFLRESSRWPEHFSLKHRRDLSRMMSKQISLIFPDINNGRAELTSMLRNYLNEPFVPEL